MMLHLSGNICSRASLVSMSHELMLVLLMLLLQGIPDSVTAVAWHPQEPQLLALGCSNGAVALLDVGKGAVTCNERATNSACCLVESHEGLRSETWPEPLQPRVS